MPQVVELTIGAIGLGRSILLVHLLVLFMAMGITAWKSRASNALATVLDVGGGLSVLLSTPVFLLLLVDHESPGQGTVGMWYVIFSVVTLGLVPLVTLLSFGLTGRLAGRLYGLRAARCPAATEA